MANRQVPAEQAARLLRAVQGKYEMRILRAEGVKSEFMEVCADVALLADLMATLYEADVANEHAPKALPTDVTRW